MVELVLSQFGRQRAAARRKYEAFVRGGKGASSPWSALRGQMLLGSQQFVNELLPARVCEAKAQRDQAIGTATAWRR